MSAELALISHESFEFALRRLAESCVAPHEGLFGPRSQMWRIGRESLIFLGAGTALLLQVAHPFVANAITQHSKALDDPLGRYYRTFRPIFAMIYGSLEQALAQARGVRAVHDRIAGQMPEHNMAPYAANEAQALLWVHATLWHTAVAVHERIFGALSEADKDTLNGEIKRFAALFGIPGELHPARWADFVAYFDSTVSSSTLCVGEAAKRIGAYFLSPKFLRSGLIVPRWYRAVTTLLLPSPIARAFGLELNSTVRAQAEHAFDLIRKIYPRLPGWLRFIGPYQEAMARLAGRPRPGLWISAANLLWLGRTRLEPVP